MKRLVSLALTIHENFITKMYFQGKTGHESRKFKTTEIWSYMIIPYTIYRLHNMGTTKLYFLTQSNMGDGDYMAAFYQLIMPVAYEVSFITLL